jgi:hypothetical protein
MDVQLCRICGSHSVGYEETYFSALYGDQWQGSSETFPVDFGEIHQLEDFEFYTTCYLQS